MLADFTIIGEAARHIPVEIQQSHPTVDWRRMSDMRNVIVHVYFSVNPRIVWDTIRDDLPVLDAGLQSLLKTLPPN